MPQHDDMCPDQGLGMFPRHLVRMVPIPPLLSDYLSGEFCHCHAVLKGFTGVTCHNSFVLSSDSVTEPVEGMYECRLHGLTNRDCPVDAWNIPLSHLLREDFNVLSRHAASKAVKAIPILTEFLAEGLFGTVDQHP